MRRPRLDQRPERHVDDARIQRRASSHHGNPRQRFDAAHPLPDNRCSAACTGAANSRVTAVTKASNAHAWLHASGVGQPLDDPGNTMVAEAHACLDTDQGGDTTETGSVSAARGNDF